VYQLWAKSGVQFASYKSDLSDTSLKVNSSPLLDPYIVSTYKWNIREAKRFGLIRSDVDLDTWIEPKFLQRALQLQALEQYWKPVDASGVWTQQHRAQVHTQSAEGGSPTIQTASAAEAPARL
jgi:sulfonate transport system substrate-binding protein